jgi:hypothetical protein
MQFKPFEPGIEVRGIGLQWVVGGFRILPEMGLRYLARYGLTTRGADGKPVLDVEGWYSQEAWLACFEAIDRQVGPSVMTDIGRYVGENAPTPPGLRDVDSSLRSLDVTYHMFHRKRGVPMFDEESGRMLEGIGHYGYERRAGKCEITCVCENPYPCNFDLGIVQGFVARFDPRAHVEHLDRAPCRKHRGESCTYVVTWSAGSRKG